MMFQDRYTRCTKQGYRAFKNGDVKSACKYKVGTQERIDWIKGWNRANEREPSIEHKRTTVKTDHTVAIAVEPHEDPLAHIPSLTATPKNPTKRKREYVKAQ